jgi:hypothetical protein
MVLNDPQIIRKTYAEVCQEDLWKELLRNAGLY